KWRVYRKALTPTLPPPVSTREPRCTGRGSSSPRALDVAYTARRVNPSRRANRLRIFRLSLGVVLFLAGFFVLLLIVSHYYLLPAIKVVPQATPGERRWLQAASALLLAVVLFVLFIGLMMVFRVGRFFLPRSYGQRTETKY